METGMETEPTAIGFLTTDGYLFCCEECANRRSKRRGLLIGLPEYEALVEYRSAEPEALCPGCGAELDLPEPETSPH